MWRASLRTPHAHSSGGVSVSKPSSQQRQFHSCPPVKSYTKRSALREDDSGSMISGEYAATQTCASERSVSTSPRQHVERDRSVFHYPPSESAVRVVARFRPLEKSEQLAQIKKGDAPFNVSVQSVSQENEHGQSSNFLFDKVFPPLASQEQVYKLVAKPLVGDVLNGFNATIFAYGQTGSGKTHTMFGPPTETFLLADERGISPRAIQQIFKHMRNASDVEYVLKCSVLEVYRETLRDLINPTQRQLQIKENPDRGVYVDGLWEEGVCCEEDIMEIIAASNRARAVAATHLNACSSRSHVIFMLTCNQTRPDGRQTQSKLTLVDLAGSEKVRKSGSQGEVLEEAKKINWSLSALGNVIQALVEKRPHVPYRDSKLTRILQETLGGNSKTTLLVTCVNSAHHAEETCSSLRFAARAQEIRNIVKINFSLSCDRLEHLMRILEDQIARMRRQNFSRLLPNMVLDHADKHLVIPESCAKRLYPQPWMRMHSRSVSRSSSNLSPERFEDFDADCVFTDVDPLEVVDGSSDKVLGIVDGQCAAYYHEHAKYTSDTVMYDLLMEQSETIDSLAEGCRAQEEYINRLESLLSDDVECGADERSALCEVFHSLQRDRASLRFRAAEFARKAGHYQLRESFQKYIVSHGLATQTRRLDPESVEYDFAATAARQQRMLLSRVERLYGC